MTAKAHNAVQTGHYEFRPRSGTVTLFAAPDICRDTMRSMFEGCGWKVKFRRKRKK